MYSSIKKLREFKREYNLHESSYFQWVQAMDSISEDEILLLKKL